MMQKRLIVTGKVQDVDYREIVKEIARKMEILGSIRNLRDGTVEILCECKNKQHLEDFKKEIWKKEKNKNKPFVNDIEELSVSNAHLSYFDIDYGDKQEEIIKKLNKGIQVMSFMNENLGNKIDKMNDNVTSRFDKMEQKYGTIGETMIKLEKHFGKLVEEFIGKKHEK